MRVLVAEDDPVARRLLQTYLERWGYEVTPTGNGIEAWEAFQAGDYPLVISDWMMPEMDGLELIRRIRTCERPGYIYTILLTAKSEKEDLVHGMDSGADDFIVKPFDRDELRVRLREGERIIDLERKLAEQSEKLASMGWLSVGTIDNLSSPIMRVINNLTLLRSELPAVMSSEPNAARMLDDSLKDLASMEEMMNDLRNSFGGNGMEKGRL